MPAAFFITKLNISVRWKMIPNGKYRTASTAIQVLCESACRLRCRFPLFKLTSANFPKNIRRSTMSCTKFPSWSKSIRCWPGKRRLALPMLRWHRKPVWYYLYQAGAPCCSNAQRQSLAAGRRQSSAFGTYGRYAHLPVTRLFDFIFKRLFRFHWSSRRSWALILLNCLQ